MYDGDHGPDTNEEAEHQRLRPPAQAVSCRDDLARQPEYCEAESDLRDAEDEVEYLGRAAAAAMEGPEGGYEGEERWVVRGGVFLILSGDGGWRGSVHGRGCYACSGVLFVFWSGRYGAKPVGRDLPVKLLDKYHERFIYASGPLRTRERT